jgi:DNA-binding XRE family transcriptional regulator
MPISPQYSEEKPGRMAIRATRQPEMTSIRTQPCPARHENGTYPDLRPKAGAPRCLDPNQAKNITRNLARCTRNHIPVTIPSVMSRKKRKHLRILFGERVRSLRLSKKLSQEALSERVGISVDFLSLIERGRNSPSFETMQSLADALNVPVDRLFTFDKDSE